MGAIEVHPINVLITTALNIEPTLSHEVRVLAIKSDKSKREGKLCTTIK